MCDKRAHNALDVPPDQENGLDADERPKIISRLCNFIVWAVRWTTWNHSTTLNNMHFGKVAVHACRGCQGVRQSIRQTVIFAIRNMLLSDVAFSFYQFPSSVSAKWTAKKANQRQHIPKFIFSSHFFTVRLVLQLVFLRFGCLVFFSASQFLLVG